MSKKSKIFPIVVIGAILIIFIILLQFIYVVREDEQVLLIQFGKILNSVNEKDKNEAGLRFKAPWTNALTFSKKIIRWDGEPDRIPTRPDNQEIVVDTSARWRIRDPEIYYKKLKGITSNAAGRLDDIIDGAVRNVIRSTYFIQVVASEPKTMIEYFYKDDKLRPHLKGLGIEMKNIDETNLILLKMDNKYYLYGTEGYFGIDNSDFVEGNPETVAVEELMEGKQKILKINGEKSNAEKVNLNTLKIVKLVGKIEGREELQDKILQIVKENTIKGFGIEILDIIIKRVDYNENNREAAYKRMIAERTKVSEEKRAIGRNKTQEIEGEMNRYIREKRSEAYERAEKIKGQGDAEAARIYAEQYQDDPEDLARGLASKEQFYEFSKMLEAYTHISKDSELTISTNSDFFRLLKNMNVTFEKND